MAPLRTPWAGGKYVDLTDRNMGRMEFLQLHQKGRFKLSRSQAFKGVFKYRTPRRLTSVKGLKLCQTKATMDAEKGMGEEAEDGIYMNVADHELFPNDPAASEGGGGEATPRPIIDAMLPQMETPDNGELNPQARVSLTDIGTVLRQAGYPITSVTSNWALEEEEGHGGANAPPTPGRFPDMEVDAIKTDSPGTVLEEDSGVEPSIVGESDTQQGLSQPESFPQEEGKALGNLGPTQTQREIPVVDLDQPNEEMASGNAKGKGPSSPQKKEPKPHAQVRQQVTNLLGFEIHPNSANPSLQSPEEVPSGTCCGAKENNGFQLHLLECVEATKTRALARARPFETTVAFLDYVRLPEDRWVIKLAPQINSNGDLLEFLRLAIPNSQELHREALRLFDRVATEACHPSQCFGNLVPLMAETYSYSWRIQLDPDERYHHLAQLHNVWRDHKRLAYEFLELVEGIGHHGGEIDCQQFDHCVSNQLRQEVSALVDRSLYLNEEIHGAFNKLDYLSAVQQSLVQTIMSSWEQDMSRCRYLLAVIRRRRIVIDSRRGVWHYLMGPSQTTTKGGAKGTTKNGKTKGWQFVKTGNFEQVAIQSKLLGLKSSKKKATQEQAAKPHIQNTKKGGAVPTLNQLPPLGKEAQRELHRMLLTLAQQEGVSGKGGPTRSNQTAPPPTPSPAAQPGQHSGDPGARKVSSRSPPRSKKNWREERRESVGSQGSGAPTSRGRGERSPPGPRETSHRGGTEKRRPRSHSREEAALEYSRDPRGTNVFQRVGGHKRRSKRGGQSNRSHYDPGHQGHYQGAPGRHR